MKATMNAKGVITIFPESDLEAYALANWSRDAIVEANDQLRLEQVYIRGSRLIVDANSPTERFFKSEARQMAI